MTRIQPRSVIYIAVLVAVLGVLVTGVYAAIVDPERIPQIGGNVDPCPADTTWLKAETGDLSAGFVSDGNVNITFDDVYAAGPEPADQQSALDWTLDTAGFTILFVHVTGGEDGGNTYDYQPEGVTTDDFLTTPGPGQGEFTFKNISHVDFCYAEAEAEEGELQPLTAVKTAAGSFGTMITWELTKTAAPTSHSGSTGDTFTSTWTVVTTKTETSGDFVVEGEITITNPNLIDVSVEIEDVLDEVTPVTVTCPDTGDHTGTVPANGELVCSYTASPDDDSATDNTAEITSLTDGVEGVTVTSGIVWTENPIGDEETLLEDAGFDFSETITETTTKTFSQQFNCSAEGTFTHDNTATLTGSETNLTASASVTVDCDDIQRPSLGVEQVTVATAVNGGATVTGSFVIKNHSGGSITRVTLDNVTLSFVSRRPGGIAVDHSAACIVTPQANGYELQPHEAKQFSYSCTITPAVPPDATELTARVTVGTATNQIGEVREKPFSATSPSFKFDGGGG